MPCRYVDVSRLYTQQPLHCGAELVHVYDGAPLTRSSAMMARSRRTLLSTLAVPFLVVLIVYRTVCDSPQKRTSA